MTECGRETEFEHRLTDVEAGRKSNTKRINQLEKRMDDLDQMTASMASMAQKQIQMEEALKEIRTDVKTIAGKPGRHWENIVEKAAAALAGGLVSYALLRLGMA